MALPCKEHISATLTASLALRPLGFDLNSTSAQWFLANPCKTLFTEHSHSTVAATSQCHLRAAVSITTTWDKYVPKVREQHLSNVFPEKQLRQSSPKQLSSEEKVCTSAGYCSWHCLTCVSICATGEYLNPAHRASRNLRKRFRLATGREMSPLFAAHGSSRSFTTGVSLPGKPAQNTWLGTAPARRSLALKSLESGNCSWLMTSSWSSDLRPVLFRTLRGFISASAGFQVPATLETQLGFYI